MWRSAGLDRLKHVVREVKVEKVSDKVIYVLVEESLCTPEDEEKFGCTYLYKVYGSGDVIVEVDVKPKKDLPPLSPRIGLQLILSEGLEKVTWYDRGPMKTIRIGRRVPRLESTA